MDFEQPQYYTRYEGDKWEPWPPVLRLVEGDLDLRAPDPQTYVIAACGVRIHALRFWDAPSRAWKRWDCINGFTD